MEQQKPISKVTEPTAWVSSLVAVKKKDSGKLRICLGPRDLKQSLDPTTPQGKLKTSSRSSQMGNILQNWIQSGVIGT